MTPSSGQSPPPAPPPDDLDALLEAYLDDTLTPEQRRAFEARARHDETLARELALQRRAEESLKRQFQPPAMPVLPTTTTTDGRALEAAPARGPSRLRLFVPLAAAAALAITAGVYLTLLAGTPVGPVYHKVVDAGFTPQWVCETDEQFTQYTKERFGTPWTFDNDPSIRLVGWRYSEDVLSPDESVLLATKGREKIVVVADEAAHDRRLRESGGLHVFRRTLGDLVLYEISPLEQPHVIGRIGLDEPGTK